MGLTAFDVRVEELDGDVRVIAVRGELDMNTAPDLGRALDDVPADEPALVVIDLSSCDFIDSTGIALVIRAWQRIDREAEGVGKGRLVLCGVSDQVQRLLKITGVESSVSAYESRDAALAELRASP